MNESLKKRLMGAAVLVALGVIFIPALLDNNRQRQELTDTMEIPAEPDIKLPEKLSIFQEKQTQLQAESEAALTEPELQTPQTEFDLLSPASDATEAPAETVTVGKLEAAAPATDQSQTQTSTPVTVGQTTSRLPLVPKAQPQTSESARSHTPISPVQTKPPISTTAHAPVVVAPAITKGWVVQVGSFSQEANARALMGRLAKLGQKAFIEKSKGRAGMIYRVRIGPVADRLSAEKLRDKLMKSGQKNLALMPYP